jgi:type VI protein secretion system component Hcp
MLYSPASRRSEKKNMAEYGIVAVIKDIKGNCQLDKYKDGILVESCSFGSSARRFAIGVNDATNARISVSQTNVTLTMLAGKWTVELFQALFASKKLGDVVITQIAQAVDKKATAEPTPIQKITLSNAHLTSLNNVWTEGAESRQVTVEIEFDKILYEQGVKPADFTVRNVTTGAV